MAMRTYWAKAGKPAFHARVKELWFNNGGESHGPHVETYTIPESKFYEFIDKLREELEVRKIDEEFLGDVK